MITFYTDRFIPERFGAVSAGPITLIRPKYKDDAGLHAHEEVHFTQWLTLSAIGPVAAAVAYLAQIEPVQPYLIAMVLVPSLFHGLLYKLVSRYRLACEVSAYKEQLKSYEDDRTELFSGFIAEKYDLGIDAATAAKYLRG